MIGATGQDSITLTTKRFYVGYAMSDETKLPPVCAGEIADAIKNGLTNEYDEGTWGLDLPEDEDPTYEDILADNEIEAIIRIIVGKQEFIVTVKEVKPHATKAVS